MRKLFLSFIFSLMIVSPCLAQLSPTQGLSKIPWVFSESDFNIELKEESVKKGKYTVEIDRSSSNEKENVLIRKAEALYPKESEMNPIEINPDYNPPGEQKPYWSNAAFGGVKVSRVISTRAILYYQEISAALRNKQNVTQAKMNSSDLRYTATIQHYDEYEVAGQKLRNVDVVVLRLGWSQNCGSQCGMSVNRRKVVIFDAKAEPVALFIDPFGGFTVS